MATVNAYKWVAPDYSTPFTYAEAEGTFTVGTDVTVDSGAEIARAPAYLTNTSSWIRRNNLGPGFFVHEFTPFELFSLQKRDTWEAGPGSGHLLQVSFNSATQQSGPAMFFWNTDPAVATFWITGCHVVSEV
jgi:hypothetical protein